MTWLWIGLGSWTVVTLALAYCAGAEWRAKRRWSAICLLAICGLSAWLVAWIMMMISGWTWS